MTEINEAFLSELDTWECRGVNVGQAIRKQFVPEHLPEVEVEDGVSEGKVTIFIKPYCPDCEHVSYGGKYCQNCGRRLRR